MSRTKLVRRTAVLSVVAASLAACEQAKSSNPLSPQVAGPMAGVVITVPLPVEPNPGQKVRDTDQPLALVIEEAHTNGPRALTMAFQIAADVGFTNVVFSQSGIVPSGEGLTRLRLPDRLPSGRNYFWRIKGEDGANTSGWSNAASFEILQPIVIGVPDPQSPVGNVRVANGTPEFKVRNGQSSGPFPSLWYNFQIADNQAFASVFTNGIVDEGGGGETRFTMPHCRPPTRLSSGASASRTDRTLERGRARNRSVLPVAAPVPSPGPSPSPGGGSARQLQVEQRPVHRGLYCRQDPERLAPVGSLGERQANMAFIRDRIIEAGKCGGLDLGWNLKRGGSGAEHRLPRRAPRQRRDGHDIGADYDNIGTTLRLQWSEAGLGASFDPYPAPNCG